MTPESTAKCHSAVYEFKVKFHTLSGGAPPANLSAMCWPGHGEADKVESNAEMLSDVF